MCNKCHTGYTSPGPEPKDCHGINCPLGIVHPPSSRDHKKSNFALGCGICRSEKASAFKGTAVQQVITTVENMPKAYGQAANDDQANRRMKGVEYPLFEHEMPEFVIWSPEERIEEDRRLAEEARLKAIEEAHLA